MNRYQIEIAKLESRTPLFYYPYHIELKSELAKRLVGYYFFVKSKQSYPMDYNPKKHMNEVLTEENLKTLSGRYEFHYSKPKESEGDRMIQIKHGVKKGLGKRGISGFLHFAGINTPWKNDALEEGRDFEIVIGERVEIEQPKKLTFDDIPDLMGINEA